MPGRAEDGALPDVYPLSELVSESSRERAVANIVDSDATVIVYFERLEAGMEQTVLHCITNHKPHLLVDAAVKDTQQAAEAIHEFIKTHSTEVVNITGPRLSKASRGQDYTRTAVMELIDLQAGA